MNTILVTVDALRADHLGQYGYTRNTMPVLDRLIEDGIMFSNGFANGPYTRISIPSIHSSARLGHSRLDSLPTISSEFSDAGLTTASVGTRTGFKSAEGALHFDQYVTLGRDDYHEESGPERIHQQIANRFITSARSTLDNHPSAYQFAEGVYNTLPGTSPGATFNYKGYTGAEDVTDAAIDWVSDHAGEDFFLWLHYMEGHRPYGPHEINPEYTSGVSHDRIRTLMKKAGTRPEEVTVAEQRKMIDLYDSDLRYCSKHIERLLDNIEELNLQSQTNVLFTSDHGEEFYEHEMFYHRNLPHDELLHVPLIVKPSEGSDSSGPIEGQRELIDVAPTILDFHDIPLPNSFEGEPLLSGSSRDVIATGSQSHDTPVVALQKDRYKYIYTPDNEFLFDLDSDPEERVNLASEQSALRQEYRSAIPEMFFQEAMTHEELRDPENEVDRERLEALGYLDT